MRTMLKPHSNSYLYRVKHLTVTTFHANSAKKGQTLRVKIQNG